MFVVEGETGRALTSWWTKVARLVVGVGNMIFRDGGLLDGESPCARHVAAGVRKVRSLN